MLSCLVLLSSLLLHLKQSRDSKQIINTYLQHTSDHVAFETIQNLLESNLFLANQTNKLPSRTNLHEEHYLLRRHRLKAA